MLYKRHEFLDFVREYLYDASSKRVLAITKGVVAAYENGEFPDYGYFNDAQKVQASEEAFSLIFQITKKAQEMKEQSEKLAQSSWEEGRRKNGLAQELFDITVENAAIATSGSRP